jgi:hypothetical protein
MASSRSRPSDGAATASDDGRRLAHELRDAHLPVLVSSRMQFVFLSGDLHFDINNGSSYQNAT